MRRALIVGLTCCACATASVQMPRTLPADLRVGALAEKTEFEKNDDGAELDEGPDKAAKQQRTRRGVFWGGIGLAAFGAAGTIAFGAVGQATQVQLKNGYDDGDLTRSKEQDLRDRGELMNSLAIVTGSLAIVGVAMAAIVYGIDYTKCGTLAKRRKDCKKNRRK